MLVIGRWKAWGGSQVNVGFERKLNLSSFAPCRVLG